MAVKFIRYRGVAIEVEEVSERELENQRWIAQYEVMLKFIETYGHQKFPYEKTSPTYSMENYKMQRWAGYQRKLYKEGKLPQWRLQLMNNVNFIWDPYDTYWNKMFDQLVEYKKIHGHCIIPHLYKENLELGEWVSKQKLRKNKLSEEKIKRLDDLGFDWGVKRTEWEIHYDWLCRYFKETGKKTIPRYKPGEYSKNELNRLYRWYSKQVTHYRNGRLSQEKIRLMEEAGVDFTPRKVIEDKVWEGNYRILEDFYKVNGHSDIPWNKGENEKIVGWMVRQRSIKDKLSEDKIKKLNAVNFTWDTKDKEWNEQFNKLKEFYKKNGHFRVTLKFDPKLFNWIKYLRSVYRGNHPNFLSEEQRKRLNDLGFEWSPGRSKKKTIL